MIIPNDANQVKMQLDTFEKNEHTPDALIQFNPQNDFQNVRYDSSKKWIDENNHAVISNGPFYLDRYSPDSRTIVIRSCLLYTSPSPRDKRQSRMPSSA